MVEHATRLKPALCPQCGTFLDAATNTGSPAKPKPDDLTLCIMCASILRYDAELKPQIPPPGWIDARFAEDAAYAEHVRSLQRHIVLMPPGKPKGWNA